MKNIRETLSIVIIFIQEHLFPLGMNKYVKKSNIWYYEITHFLL